MNPAEIESVLSGKRTDVRARGLRFFLNGLEPIYTLGALTNRFRYDFGWAKVFKVEAPVISVGNLTTGGTGKTPFAAWLVQELKRMGKTPGIASRGYKSLNNSEASSESQEHLGNDEKLVLDKLCPGTAHLQQRDRVSAARQLLSEYDCDCIILDDGFQHRRLHRDLNVVLIDAVTPFGYGHLLPRGLLREPLSSLRRADVIVLTRVEQVSSEALKTIKEKLKRSLKNDEIPIIEVSFEPESLIDLSGNRFPLQELPSDPTVFCGIGNPTGFQQLLESISKGSCPENRFFVFPDHHHYTESEVRELCEKANSPGSPSLLTTLKDLVKLSDLVPESINCYALNIEAKIVEGKSELQNKLSALF